MGASVGVTDLLTSFTTTAVYFAHCPFTLLSILFKSVPLGGGLGRVWVAWGGLGRFWVAWGSLRWFWVAWAGAPADGLRQPGWGSLGWPGAICCVWGQPGTAWVGLDWGARFWVVYLGLLGPALGRVALTRPGGPWHGGPWGLLGSAYGFARAFLGTW